MAVWDNVSDIFVQKIQKIFICKKLGIQRGIFCKIKRYLCLKSKKMKKFTFRCPPLIPKYLKK